MTAPERATRDHFFSVLMSLGVPPPTHKQVAGISTCLLGGGMGVPGERGKW